MKKQLLFIAALQIAALTTSAQSIVLDTVSLGAGYAQQTWYSLSGDEQGSQAKNNWDLAFSTSGSMGSSILVNHSNGGLLWVYPKADKTAWASIDTSGLSGWEAQYNMETQWTGALGRYTNPADAFDLGWGVYDMGTHFVNGDSIYIIKTQAGNFKKLFIEKLASGTYTFRFANLDGSDSSTASLSKSSYSDKNFGYYNLDTKSELDREAPKNNWDLVFGQYSTGDYASMGMTGYTVTGILLNDSLQVAKANVDPSLRNSYTSYGAHTFSNEINSIGYNWKTYSGGTYLLNDSSIYFIRRNNGEIWKLILTGFSSSTGSTMFSKEQLSTTSIQEQQETTSTLAITPNPSVSGQAISIVYHFKTSKNRAQVLLYDLSGRLIQKAALETSAGLHSYTIKSNQLLSGMYIAQLQIDNEQVQQKFIVQ